MSIRVTTFAAAVAVLALAGCGGDDGGDATLPMAEADSTVTVIAEDIDFGQDSYEAPAGTVGFVYENAGSIRHTLLIEDVDGFKLEVRSRGDVDEGAVELEPGEYLLYCDVAGHQAGGMVASLEVT